MAGHGPAPKPQRFRRNTPTLGEWQPSPESGWQHPLPPAPKGLLPATARIWEGWFRAWWAGHWSLDDLPQLRFAIRLVDRVRRGDVQRLPELRQWLDMYGISPKGQQDRRWQRPAPPKPKDRWSHSSTDSPYRHLRVTDDHLSAKERFAVLEATTRPPEGEEP